MLLHSIFKLINYLLIFVPLRMFMLMGSILLPVSAKHLRPLSRKRTQFYSIYKFSILFIVILGKMKICNQVVVLKHPSRIITFFEDT